MTTSLANASFATGLAISSNGVAYSLANNGTALLSYNIQTPFRSTIIDLSGSVESLSAIDFRPATGQLFGYDDATDSYVTLNPFNGITISASGEAVTATNTPILDIDWNPTIDRLRTVTETDQNIVYNPNNGQASDSATTNLFYAEGDIQEGANPSIVANAYSNSVANATQTTQYALDSVSNTLVTLDNNAGSLNTIGTLTLNDGILDFGNNAGFDIVTDGLGNNTAYASLEVNGNAALYTIDLQTAEADLVGFIDNDFITPGGNGGLFSTLGLDNNSFGIDAGSEFAASLGLI